MSLISIPEVTIHILTHLPASKYDDTSVRALIACTKTSRALRDIAQTDSLWAEHYRVRWTRPELDSSEQRRWYELYCTRRQTDVRTLSLLDTIITTPSKRGSSAVDLVELKDDAWDVLRMEAGCKFPEGVQEVWKKEEGEWAAERWEGIGEEWKDGTGSKDLEREKEVDTREMKPDWIQRRWWAKQVLGTMARTAGVITMIKVFNEELQLDPASFENARSFEEGLKALSGLMGVNTGEISHNYDNLARACSKKLVQDGICVDPASQEFDLRKFSSGICDWMRSQGFKKAAGDGQYYDLMNHFPHTFMTTNRRTLPMSLAYTFVAIATRLGLRSAPVGFPGHVHAWIALPSYQSVSLDEAEIDWEKEDPLLRVHVDVFHSEREPFLASEKMRHGLEELQVPEEQFGLLMRPSAASEMILRAANNVLHSVTRIQHQPNTQIQAEARAAALYASAMTFLISRPQAADAARFVGGVVSVVKEQFPLDTEPVLSRLLKIVSNPEIIMHLRTAIARLRNMHVDVKQRDAERYWVGMVFRHANYGYEGVIVGWDSECAAEERWMIEAGVDALPRGRGQPFYTVLAADGTSRYVAEENVIPLPLLANALKLKKKATWETVRDLMLAGTSTIEQAFSRVEVDEELGRAWFVPAVSTAEEYPDDTALGQEYMQKPWHRYQ